MCKKGNTISVSSFFSSLVGLVWYLSTLLDYSKDFDLFVGAFVSFFFSAVIYMSFVFLHHVYHDVKKSIERRKLLV